MAGQKTPTIQLSLLRDSGYAPKHEVLHSVEKRRLRCNPKGFWIAWQEDMLQPSHDWRTSTKQLILSASVKCSAGRRQVTVLVDTGAKIPLVFNKNLFKEDCLTKAIFPVHFTTADGQSMEGGSHGLFMGFDLPLWRQGRLITAKNCPLFGYCAAINGVDILLGYHFLKAFGISIDTTNDRLCLGTEKKMLPWERKLGFSQDPHQICLQKLS